MARWTGGWRDSHNMKSQFSGVGLVQKQQAKHEHFYSCYLHAIKNTAAQAFALTCWRKQMGHLFLSKLAKEGLWQQISTSDAKISGSCSDDQHHKQCTNTSISISAPRAWCNVSQAIAATISRRRWGKLRKIKINADVKWQTQAGKREGLELYWGSFHTVAI